MLRRFLTAVSVAVILAVTGLLVTGHVAFVSTSGTSMLPTYQHGDLVVVVRSGTYEAGQNVAYRDPGTDVVALHRIVGGDADAFELRGDNNRSIDPHQPSADEIIGREMLHVPALGGWLSSPVVRTVLVVGSLTLAGGLLAARRSRSPRRAASASSSSTTADGAASDIHDCMPLDHRRSDQVGTLDGEAAGGSSLRYVWMMLLALTTLLGAAVAISFVFPSRAATDIADRSVEITGTLGYLATVPPGATYPSGRVTTGDPVFREVVDTVDTSFAFSAEHTTLHGVGRLELELAGVAGWSTTLPLVAETPLDDGAVTLDGTIRLAELDRLAEQVTAETNMAMSPLTVRVIAVVDLTVDGDELEPFEMDMAFQLTDRLLSLRATSDVAAGEDIDVKRTITAPGEVEVRASPGVPSEARTALLIGFLVTLAATALVWPERRDPGVARIATNDLWIHPTSSRVELRDRTQLEQVAADLGLPILVRGDRWEGVVTPSVVYWRTRSRPSDVDPAERDQRGRSVESAEPAFPAPHPADRYVSTN